ncbi:MAG: helix-turn-helix domain-containing protein [Evtepia gabavorous]
MAHYVTGPAIKALRERKGLTQKQLAEQILVSDKAVSKWETGKGLPDLSLLEPLAKALGVSVAELLSGEYRTNANRAGNLLRSQWYVCPVCGNVVYALGQGSFHCCGVALPPAEAEEAEREHAITVEQVEDDYYVTLDHPMSKGHFLSFVAYLTTDRVLLQRPIRSRRRRFASRLGPGQILAYCNRHGLFRKKIS